MAWRLSLSFASAWARDRSIQFQARRGKFCPSAEESGARAVARGRAATRILGLGQMLDEASLCPRSVGAWALGARPAKFEASCCTSSYCHFTTTQRGRDAIPETYCTVLRVWCRFWSPSLELTAPP